MDDDAVTLASRVDGAPPRLALLVILLIAAVLRLAAAFTIGDVTELHGDEGYYVSGARALAAGEGYPGSLRPPGYSAFLATALRLGSDDLRAARVAQIAVSLIGIAALFALVRGRFGVLAASLSALLCALHPTLIVYGHLLWSETLVAALLLLALACLDRFDLERREWWLVAAGIVFGALVLTRDMLLFFVPLIALWLWIDPAGVRRDRLRRIALVVLPVLLLIAPWMVRNQRLLGRPFVLSTNSWFPLAVGNLIPRDRVLGMADENRAFNRAYSAVRGGELERDAFARAAALRAIAERQPAWLVNKLLRNTYYLFSTASQLKRFVKEDWVASGWRAAARRLTTGEAAYYVATTVLGVVALWLVPGGRTKLLVVTLILFHWAVYVVANATHRFRVPLLPLFLLYVGPLLAGVRLRPVARWRIAGALVCLMMFAAVVATPYVRRGAGPVPAVDDAGDGVPGIDSGEESSKGENGRLRGSICLGPRYCGAVALVSASQHDAPRHDSIEERNASRSTPHPGPMAAHLFRSSNGSLRKL